MDVEIRLHANDISDSAYDLLLALNDLTSLGNEIALSVILLLDMFLLDNSFSVWPQIGLYPNVLAEICKKQYDA